MEVAQVCSRALQVSGAACCRVSASVTYSEAGWADFRCGAGRLVAGARCGDAAACAGSSLGGMSLSRSLPTVRSLVVRSATMESASPQKHEFYTVGDFMTPLSELLVATKSTTVDQALEALVDNRITGMPVVDDAGKLIGVVSDYDLLALDSISGKRTTEMGLFPEPGSTWKAFKEIQKLLVKTNGRTVGEVMTPSPLVVREMTNLEDAAKLLLDSRYRRLPVVDDEGRLVGLLTRGNVVRAALQAKRAAGSALKESRSY